MLIWMDGFDSYGTSGSPAPAGIITRKYTTATEGNITIATGRIGGKAITLSGGIFSSLGPGNITADGTMVVGAAIKFAGLYNGRFFLFFDGVTEGMNLRVQTDGELAVYLSDTLKQTTLGLGLVGSIWYYIEFKVLCALAGTYEVRVNGVTVLTGSCDTRGGSNSYNTTFRLQGNTASFDDLYCLDGTGSVNNNFLGNMRIETMRPSANGTSTQWTPDSGSTNYTQVDEQICDDNTTYVEDGTTGHKDLYSYGGVGLTTGIKGVKINTDAEATDVTSTVLIDKCSSNGTESSSSNYSISVNSYATYGRILETDPDTAAAWSASAVNAAEFGIEVG